MIGRLAGRWFNSTGDRYLTRNYILNTTDGMFFALAMGMVPLNTVLTYFISGYVSQKWLIGLLTFLYTLLMFSPQILVSRKLEKLRRFKPFLITSAVFVRLLWLLMGLNVLLFADKNPLLFVILFYLLFSLIGLVSAFTGITWLNFIVKIIPENYRGRFFGIRSTLCGLFEMAGSIFMGILLKSLPSPLNYGVLFIIVFVLTSISICFVLFSKEEAVVREQKEIASDSYIYRISSVLKNDRNFSNYLLTVLLIGALGKMPFAFQILFAKEKLGITAVEVSYATFVLLAFQTVGYLAWGIIGDKKGFKVTLEISAAIYLPSLLFTYLMSSRFVFYLAIALFGLAQSARNVNENNLAINLCRETENQPLYIGLRNLLLGPAFALCPLLAGFLLDFIGLGLLFTISALFMAAGFYTLLKYVKEYR